MDFDTEDFYNTLDSSEKEYHELFDIFTEELAVFQTKIREGTNQSWRRAYTRTLFSMIEALTYRLKEDIYALLEAEGAEISSEHERDLKGKIIKRNKNGQLKIRHFYQKLTDSIEYTLYNYARMHYIEYKIDKTGADWRCFVASVKIRNRITHPKKPSDLVIDNNELVIIQSSGKWFLDTIKDIYKKSAASLFDVVDALERNWEKQHPNKNKLIIECYW